MLTDAEAFQWIVKHRATVEYHEFLPNGKKNDRPWWVVVDGPPHMNPWVGVTLNGAIYMFAYIHREALASQLSHRTIVE